MIISLPIFSIFEPLSVTIRINKLTADSLLIYGEVKLTVRSCQCCWMLLFVSLLFVRDLNNLRQDACRAKFT
ncbi:hypothetical protein BpHYR1_000239 [Brachionus plicatilis]|uniref:Uncharacterized protein n=1 Tax=Brachionus plicatilis TaxID=10195 RepID=A0A3M7PFK6_BRAPC|nr:hypothetical protein BpHYR1_000239 [Brachionus plicatilis]